jgi:putative transposase
LELPLCSRRPLSQTREYLLHEFVLRPDHFHLLLTPLVTLERSLQLIKGSFSFRARKELGFGGEIWQPSFYDRRVRDWQEYCTFREYIRSNPVKKKLALVPEGYPMAQQILRWRWMRHLSG